METTTVVTPEDVANALVARAERDDRPVTANPYEVGVFCSARLADRYRLDPATVARTTRRADFEQVDACAALLGSSPFCWAVAPNAHRAVGSEPC